MTTKINPQDLHAIASELEAALVAIGGDREPYRTAFSEAVHNIAVERLRELIDSPELVEGAADSEFHVGQRFVGNDAVQDAIDKMPLGSEFVDEGKDLWHVFSDGISMWRTGLSEWGTRYDVHDAVHSAFSYDLHQIIVTKVGA